MKGLSKLTGLFFLTALLLFSSCKKYHESTAGVRVRFINQTGTEIVDANAETKRIGNLQPGEQTGYIVFPEFGIDTGMPDIQFTGVVNGKELTATSQFYWCGTQKSKLTEGIYTAVITYAEINGRKYFSLSFKR